MRTITLLLTIIFLAACPCSVHAGTLSGSISGESLSSSTLEYFCLGLNYDNGKRGIKSDSGDTRKLETQVYSLFLGYDLSNWCTLFATLGQSEAKLPGYNSSKFGQGKGKWSLGLNANLWHVELTDPPLFTGRISLKPAIELSRYNSSLDNRIIEWTDISGAILICYEKVIEDPKYNVTQFYGYTIYGGPAFSVMNGSISGETDFTEEKSIGLIAGLDFFITSNFSLGGQIQSFDELSGSLNFRYHF